MKNEEDKLLYKEFLNGDTSALEKIVIKYKNNLMYFILRYVKNVDLAEDIFQNVIIYILEKKEQYDFKYSLKTYLYTIAKSKSLNYIKKNNNYTSLSENDTLYEEEKLLEDIILTEERREKIISIMKKLNEEHQQVIYLTIIEGLSYEDTAKIMEKSISQIKNLVHRARTKMKKLLIEERVIEMKNNKIIKLLVWIIIVGVISSGAVYATMKIYENIKGKANMTPIYTGKIGNTDYNSIWVGTFNLAWNELMDKYTGGNVKFDVGNTELVDELNKQTFKKSQLSEEDYYIKVGETSKELKKQILTDIKNKFNIDNSTALEKIDFEGNNDLNDYTIYSILSKEFEFLVPFDKLGAWEFGKSENAVEYFGIINSSEEELNDNVEVLFYNSENDYSVKLKTRENEEIILYRTNENKSFDEYYNDIKTKNNNYSGNKVFTTNDQLKVPYINIDTIINYDELCGKWINENIYIKNAIQNVKFILGETGGKLTSEATIEYEENLVELGEIRFFDFDDTFVLFMKEKDKEQPYMSLKVDNTDILKESTKR